MIEWTIRVLAASLLICLAAAALDRALAWSGRVRRFAWAGAIGFALFLPLLAWMIPGALPGVDLPLLPAELGLEPVTASDPTIGPARASTAAAPGINLAAIALGAWAALSATALG